MNPVTADWKGFVPFVGAGFRETGRMTGGMGRGSTKGVFRGLRNWRELSACAQYGLKPRAPWRAAAPAPPITRPMRKSSRRLNPAFAMSRISCMYRPRRCSMFFPSGETNLGAMIPLLLVGPHSGETLRAISRKT